MARTKTLTLEQLACFESPTRVAVYGALRSLGPSSIREVASHVGARPDALYYHMRRLVESGLAVVTENRERGGRKEAVFDIVGGPYAVEELLSDPDYQVAALRSIQGISRHAQRTYKKAIQSLPRHPERQDQIAFHWINAKLKPATIKRILKKLDDLIIESMRIEEGETERMMLFAMASPIVGREKKVSRKS
jgi:DNA-binding transcriptional ArsR family regulator